MLLVGLGDPVVREEAWRRTERDGSPRIPELWWALVRHAVPPWNVAPLFLLGWAAWRRRDLPLANAAVQRALAVDPGDNPARLLTDVLRRRVDPGSIPRLDRASARPSGRSADCGRP